MNKVISVCNAKKRLDRVYDYFVHLKNCGVIETLSEEDQRVFRSVYTDLENIVIADWTTNYY